MVTWPLTSCELCAYHVLHRNVLSRLSGDLGGPKADGIVAVLWELVLRTDESAIEAAVLEAVDRVYTLVGLPDVPPASPFSQANVKMRIGDGAYA